MTDFANEMRTIGKRLEPRGRTTDGRSVLYHWMYKRADLIRRLLDDSHPSWASVAAALADQGLTNGHGKPLDAERVRKTWFDVRRAKGWTSTQPTPQPAKPAALPSPPPIAPAPRPAVAADPQPAPVQDDDARARIERLMREMDRRSGRNV